MKIKNILDTKGGKVFTVDGESTIHDAIKQLVENNVGSLVVLDREGKLAGILTERDILKESYRRLELMRETRVKEIMTTRLFIARPEDEVQDAQLLMTEKRIRHLPILDQGRLVGLISIGDVNKILQGEREMENRDLRDYIYGKYS